MVGAAVLADRESHKIGPRQPPSWPPLTPGVFGQGTAFKTNARNYTDTDASDIDFVELPGNSTHPPATYVVYCTGNQQIGYAYNAAAMVDAPLQAWLQSYF